MQRGRIATPGEEPKECQWEVLQLAGEEVLDDHGAPWSEGCREIVLVFPGNPGVVHFYGPFLLSLRDAMGAGVGLLCCGYAGHSLEPCRNGGPFSVGEQAEVAAVMARRVLAAHPAAELHILGHSVGAHIALLTADRLPPGNVATVAGLFPTVHRIADAPNGTLWPLLLPVARHCVAAFAAALGCLPVRCRAAVVRRAKPELALPGAGAFDGVVARMASYRVLLNVLFMARTEFLAIRDVDEARVQRHASRLVLYYGARDRWVPPEHRAVLRRVLGLPPDGGAARGASVGGGGAAAGHTHPAVVIDTTGAPHAFVLTHSADVAAALAPLLCRPAGRAASPNR